MNKMAMHLGELIAENATRRAIEGSRDPYSWERIDSPKDGVNFRIADCNDDRVATRYSQEEAERAVALLNSGVKVPNLLKS